MSQGRPPSFPWLSALSFRVPHQLTYLPTINCFSSTKFHFLLKNMSRSVIPIVSCLLSLFSPFLVSNPPPKNTLSTPSLPASMKVLPYCLALITCSALSYSTQDHQGQRWHDPQWPETYHNVHQNRKYATISSHRPIHRGQLSQLIFPLQRLL